MFKKMLVVFVLMFLVGLMSGREVRADCGDNMVLVNGQCECVEGYRDSDGDLSNGCEDLECGANMERDFNWDCVCKSGYADCDGDVSNGCESDDFCYSCESNDDCMWCGSICHSGAPMGTMCIMSMPVGTCGCVDGMCTKDTITPPSCGDNMVLVNGQCECVEGYRDSDGDLSNGCEDLECGANMERDFNWDCVCKSGYADCDGDVSNGCEILGKCNCLDDSDCFWCGADCISGRIDDGRACLEHKGDDSCGCVSGSCGSVGCINNMKMVDGVCVCGEPKGDFNGDGLVDIANDLIGWYTSYRGGGNTKADFNCSGEVDISDLVSWYTNYRSMNNKADLIIESIEIEKIDQPNFPCLGYKYSVLVKNIGNVNANVSRIKTEVSPSQPQRTNNCTDYQLYDGSNAPIPANDLIKEDYLAPGLHELYSDYFNPSEDGTVTIKAIADMNGEVDEKNENNNIMVKTFDVEKTFEIAPTSTPAPTNTPSAIGFADVGAQFVDFPTSLNIGDTFDISMKITNVGNIQTSETITIKLFKKFEAGDSEEISRNVLSVPINPSSFYTWTRTSEEIDDFGFYMYTVTVDMLGEMGNIAPNSASKSFTVYDPDVPTATPASP